MKVDWRFVGLVLLMAFCVAFIAGAFSYTLATTSTR